MSLNYAFGFSLLLLSLVGLNIYFFYTLNSSGRHDPNYTHLERNANKYPRFKRITTERNVFNDILEHLHHLPSQYRQKNSKFKPTQRSIINSFNATGSTSTNVWDETKAWLSEDSLFPYMNGISGRLLQALRTSQITLVDNAPKGTQLKLLLIIEGKHKVIFKPKRYPLNNIINGNIYAGFDRHNSEIFGYYLAMILGFQWVAPATLRDLHIDRDIIAHATPGLMKTMKKDANGKTCIFGKCFYCKINETVCPNSHGLIEGAVILYYDKQFTVYKSPWMRSYTSSKREWEIDNDYCKKVMASHDLKRILNLVDVSIFDFLIQNGDRHRYEVYKDKIVLLDNGKGLGNPNVDEVDILAPLYQCCIISWSTWQRLELLSGGSLTETLKTLSTMHSDKLATEQHFVAVDRRLLKIFATVQYCIGKHGSAKVFKYQSR